jgi:hypothetical protein
VIRVPAFQAVEPSKLRATSADAGASEFVPDADPDLPGRGELLTRDDARHASGPEVRVWHSGGELEKLL